MFMTESATNPSDEDLAARLVVVGERIELATRYTREEIARFATLTLDHNPVHHDRAAAQRAGLADVIASGQHTSALMSGMAATYFSRSDDGLARSMLCLHFNFAYREPIFAERDVSLRWIVSDTEWNTSLDGVIAQLEGKATIAGAVAVVARGTVLVRRAARE
jgi:acyl dehydratase